jgi:hypothetical protein
MDRLLKYRLILGLAAFLSVSTTFAVTPCPTIRPPALSREQVDAIVLNSFATWLARPIAESERTETIKAIDHTDNAILTYSFGALDLGRFLGFNAIIAFETAAQAKGKGPPFLTMTVAEMQSIAWATYAAGSDEPYPAAVEHAQYPLRGEIIVSTPNPAEGWSLMRCLRDTIVFVRSDGNGVITAKAMALAVSLPSVHDKESFLRLVNGIPSHLTNEEFTMSSHQAVLIKNSSVLCANFQFSGGAGQTSESIIGRICQSAKRKDQGYAAYYAQDGTIDQAALEKGANDFIEHARLDSN